MTELLSRLKRPRRVESLCYRVSLSVLFPVFLFLLDRLLKQFYFNAGLLVLNRGVAFGAFAQLSPILIGFGFLFLIILSISSLRSASMAEKQSRWDCRVGGQARNDYRRRCLLAMTPCGLFLIFLGSLSNLVDRFIYNGVVDYIRPGAFLPAFNLADVMIVVGVGVAVWKHFKS